MKALGMSVWSSRWLSCYNRTHWIWTIPWHSTVPTEAYSRSLNRRTPHGRLLLSFIISRKRWISWEKRQDSDPSSIITNGSSSIQITLLPWGSVGLPSEKQESCWAAALTPDLASCFVRRWKLLPQTVNRDHSISTLSVTYSLETQVTERMQTPLYDVAYVTHSFVKLQQSWKLTCLCELVHK